MISSSPSLDLGFSEKFALTKNNHSVREHDGKTVTYSKDSSDLSILPFLANTMLPGDPTVPAQLPVTPSYNFATFETAQ
jgi:hypothetical protein